MSDYISKKALLEKLKYMGDYNIDMDYVTAEDIMSIPSAEPCDDCISRKEVQDYIAKYLSQYLYDDIRSAVETIDAYIGDMPSVQPIRPKGEWIAQDIHNCHTKFKCSNCGIIHDFMHLYGEPTADYTFCPNCGADMRGEKDGNA